MTFVITLQRGEDGWVVAECPAIPGCVSQGRTESDAIENIRLAIRECLEVRVELGMPQTVSTHQVDVDE